MTKIFVSWLYDAWNGYKLHSKTSIASFTWGSRRALIVLYKTTTTKWSIFPISFDFFWHEGGMMEHFCNEKVWSVDQKEHFIFWDFHDFIFYASPPKFGGGDRRSPGTLFEKPQYIIIFWLEFMKRKSTNTLI